MSSPDAGTDHQFRPAQAGDSRSPCPGLNTLANHGVLPHDGKDITVSQLAAALKEGFNLSTGFGFTLALMANTICGNSNWTLDLHNIARADRLEHRASLVHADADPGATLLQQLLDDCPPEGMQFEDLVHVRVRRDNDEARPLSTFHSTMALAEATSLFNRFADDEGKVSKERLVQFLGEERFPDAWIKPTAEQTFMGSFRDCQRMAKDIAAEKSKRV